MGAQTDRALRLLTHGAVCLALLTPIAGALERTGILATGEVFPRECPILSWFQDEPGFFVTMIPTKADFVMLLSLEESRRLIRLYYPRTRQQLVDDYSYVAMIDTDLGPYTSAQLGELRASIEEDGLSAFVSLGGGVFTFNYGMWAASSLADVFPHDFLATTSGQLAPAFSIEVNQRADLAPVLKMLVPFGIEKVFGKTWGHIYPREGSTIWAEIRPLGTDEKHPFLVSMSFGTGGATTWGIADDLDHPWWSSVYEPTENEYAQDVFLNVVHHSLGYALPNDLLTIHALRIQFTSYNSWKSIALATIDFLETFGAPTTDLLAGLQDLDEGFSSAKQHYAAQEHEEASVIMEEIIASAKELDQEAMMLRRRTLLWIQVTEWVVITATFLLAGALLNTLMIKRKLFREARATRFESS